MASYLLVHGRRVGYLSPAVAHSVIARRSDTASLLWRRVTERSLSKVNSVPQSLLKHMLHIWHTVVRSAASAC